MTHKSKMTPISLCCPGCKRDVAKKTSKLAYHHDGYIEGQVASTIERVLLTPRYALEFCSCPCGAEFFAEITTKSRGWRCRMLV